MNPSCSFCEHRCRLGDGKKGRCGVRLSDGKTISTVDWGQVLPPAVDPIEKKPFHHFLPGTTALSLAMLGCNFTCDFCQNFRISQKEHFPGILTKALSPEEIGQWMEDTRTSTVAYTYSEPTVWQDYMLACAREVHQRQGTNVMVTNGYFTEEARQSMVEFIDGFNIDLKGSDEFYRKYCGATQAPILRNIAALAREPQVVLEVTTLYIQSRHTRQELLDLGKALEDAGTQVWHLSLFFPAYQAQTEAPTNEAQALEVYQHLREQVKIPYLYLGNTRGREGLDTPCPGCGTPVIKREKPFGAHTYLNGNACPGCGTKIYGRFS